MKSVPETIVLLLVCGVVYAVTEEVKTVMEGDSVTLHTNVTELESDGDKIVWRLVENGSRPLLVEVYKNKNEYHDTRFKDRLQISSQIGSLTIKNMKTTYSGLYEADIQDGSGSPQSKKFRVIVNETQRFFDDGTCEVKPVPETEGASVTLHTDVQTHRDDLILWRFGPKGVLIAKHDKEDNKISIYDDDDEGFRGRLKIDDQTGSLTISDVRSSDSGLYKLKISSINRQTYKTFSVYMKGTEWLKVAIVSGLVVICVVVAVAILSRCVSRCIKNQKVKEKKVKEGDSLFLESDVTDLKSGDMIQWSFKEKLIVTCIKKDKSVIFSNAIIKDRLKVDVQTGSFIIRNMRKELSGLHKVKVVRNSSQLKSFLQRITGGPACSQFNVSVYEEKMAMDESSVILHPHTEIQSNGEIEWMFEDEVIIKGNSRNNISEYDGDDVRFHGNLELKNETGSLTIKRVNQNVTGFYKVKITSSTGTSYCLFNVITEEVMTPLEGESVTLRTGFYKLPKDTEIKWMFKDEVIITGGTRKKNTISEYDGNDERFKDRMELNNIDGYLTIRDIEKTNEGLYKVEITTKKEKSFLQYHVHVTDLMKFAALLLEVAEVNEGSVLMEAGVQLIN